jgi:hypothetical protein
MTRPTSRGQDKDDEYLLDDIRLFILDLGPVCMESRRDNKDFIFDLNFGWMIAYTIGLKTVDVFAMRPEMADKYGVISSCLPNSPIIAVTVYGSHDTTKRQTKPIIINAVRISARTR